MFYLTLPYVLPYHTLTLRLTLSYILPYLRSYLTLTYMLPYLTLPYEPNLLPTLPYILPYLSLHVTLPYLTNLTSDLTSYLTIPYVLTYLTIHLTIRNRILALSVDISTSKSSHMSESCYSFSYRNLRNYLSINKFQFNKKVILKIIK